MSTNARILCSIVGQATFHKFIIITMMLLFRHDSAIGWEEVLGVTLGGSRARRFTRLVEFAQAGFIAGAADRLFRTPSAITRQLQRPGAALQIPITSRLM